MTKSFIDVMGKVQQAQADYRSKFRQRMERQYKIAKPDATEAEIEAALDQKKPIFAEQVSIYFHYICVSLMFDFFCAFILALFTLSWSFLAHFVLFSDFVEFSASPAH